MDLISYCRFVHITFHPKSSLPPNLLVVSICVLVFLVAISKSGVVFWSFEVYHLQSLGHTRCNWVLPWIWLNEVSILADVDMQRRVPTKILAVEVFRKMQVSTVFVCFWWLLMYSSHCWLFWMNCISYFMGVKVGIWFLFSQIKNHWIATEVSKVINRFSWVSLRNNLHRIQILSRYTYQDMYNCVHISIYICMCVCVFFEFIFLYSIIGIFRDP